MFLEMLLMFDQETFAQEIFGRELRFPRVALLILGVVFLASSSPALAQRGGGGGRGMSSPNGGAGRPDGVGEGDDLKGFHRAVAVQASADQHDAFVKVAQLAQAASDQLRDFRDSLQKAPVDSTSSDHATSINLAVEKARSGNQNFLSSFSAAQKNGLKDFTRKLAKTDSELDKQAKALDQVVHNAKSQSEQLSNSAASLEKALTSFQGEQLALGKEMSIIIPTVSQELTFNLPAVTNSVNFGGQSVSIPASRTMTRASSGSTAENGLNSLTFQLTADLSDLQQHITAVLRSRLARSPRCGERIKIQQAVLTPLVPASVVVASLHYERWVCPLSPSRESPTEVADGDAKVEIKLTPSVDEKTGLSFVSELNRVESGGSIRDLLRSGDLGVTLREQIAAVVLAVLRTTAELKIMLPAPIQASAVLSKAQFQDAGADQLSLVLEGKLQLSGEQMAQLATQLKQRQSAQEIPAP
jgi:hypothetical protein